MKKAFFFAIVFLIAVRAQGTASIDLQVSNGEAEQVLVYPVLNGKFFFRARYFQPIDADGKAKIEFGTDAPGFCYLFVQGLEYDNRSWSAIQLFVEPGGKYSVTLDAKAPRQSLSIEGGRPAEQRFLNSRERYFIQYSENTARRTAWLSFGEPERIYDEIAAQMEAELKALGSLHRAGKLSDTFLAYAREDARLFYYTTFSYLVKAEGMEWDGFESTFKAGWEKPANEMLQAAGPHNRYKSSSIWYRDLLDYKMRHHMLSNLAAVKEAVSTYDNQHSLEWEMSKQALSEPELEIHAAHLIAEATAKKDLNEEALQLYLAFKDRFPQSGLLRPLSELAEPQLKALDGEEKDPEVRILSGTYTTLEDLALRAWQDGADIVLLDLWATWCGPCIREFQELEALKEYVQAQEGKIAVAYLSIDRENKRGQWERLIHHYELRGYHLLVNQQLRDELHAVFGKNGGSLDVPTYAILSKEGQVLLKDAAHPSQWEQLRAQLEAALVDRK